MSRVKTSENDGKDPYIRDGFYMDPRNQWWNKKGQVVVDSEKGTVDVVRQSTPTTAKRLNRWVARCKKNIGGKLHHL